MLKMQNYRESIRDREKRKVENDRSPSQVSMGMWASFLILRVGDHQLPPPYSQRVMAALSLRSERPLSFEREAANERETHGLNPLKHSFSPLVTEITIFRRFSLIQ